MLNLPLVQVSDAKEVTSSGKFAENTKSANVENVLAEIQAAFEQEQDRLAYLKEAAEQD